MKLPGYLYIEYPDMEKELAILRAKLPHVDDRLCAQVALAVQKLRSNESILKKPFSCGRKAYISIGLGKFLP